MQKQERCRFTIDVSKALADEVKRLAESSGKSQAEVFRTAISLLSAAHKAQDDHMVVGAWREDRESGVTQQREFVGL